MRNNILLLKLLGYSVAVAVEGWEREQERLEIQNK